MSNTIRATVNLSQQDLENIDMIQNAFQTNTRISAIANALAIARDMIEVIKTGGEVSMNQNDGQVRNLYIPGISRGKR